MIARANKRARDPASERTDSRSTGEEAARGKLARENWLPASLSLAAPCFSSIRPTIYIAFTYPTLEMIIYRVYGAPPPRIPGRDTLFTPGQFVCEDSVSLRTLLSVIIKLPYTSQRKLQTIMLSPRTCRETRQKEPKLKNRLLSFLSLSTFFSLATGNETLGNRLSSTPEVSRRDRSFRLSDQRCRRRRCRCCRPRARRPR